MKDLDQDMQDLEVRSNPIKHEVEEEVTRPKGNKNKKRKVIDDEDEDIISVS